MAASRTHLAKHIQDNPILERATPNNQVSNDTEREELKNALVATQVDKITDISPSICELLQFKVQ